jgi:DNA-binding CsgD family transcriptional regulator
VEAGARDMRASLLLLGRSRPCAALSLQWYALRHGLTPAETQVLGALCAGESPAEIAARQGVALSTVRSHVGSARAKTGTPSIRRLCERVALLPPLAHALSACG